MPEIIPDTNDDQITIPKKPVAVARWAGKDKHRPSMPKVQPDDSALRPMGIKPPAVNRAIGTDKVKKVKYKRANTANTRTPSYLKNPSPPPPVAKEMTNLEKLQEIVSLEKISLPALAGLGLGWYISDSLTRDEKQRRQRELEAEWQRAIERSGRAGLNRKVKKSDSQRSAGSVEKSAMDRLYEYWENNENVVFSDSNR